jgi:hypothetical protein
MTGWNTRLSAMLTGVRMNSLECPGQMNSCLFFHFFVMSGDIQKNLYRIALSRAIFFDCIVIME